MKRIVLCLIFLTTFIFSISAQNLFLYEKNPSSQIQLTAAKPNRPGNTEKPNRPGNTKNNEDDNDSTFTQILFEIIFDICDQIWIFSHMNADYDIAPFATRSSYIDFKEESWQTEKFYRYTFETGAFFFPKDLTVGNESRIEGITYKFFGPVFENTVFTSLKPAANKKFWLEGNLRLGGQLNLLNFNMLNIALNMQWTHWYGSKTIDGMCMGFTFRSYPVKPVLLEWRTNWQAYISEDEYNDFSTYYESHLELGIMTSKQTEVYGAWKYVNDRYNDIIKNGVAAGVKLHL